MSLCRVNKHLSTKLLSLRCFSTIVPDNEEYTATPQYPPILDLSYEAKLLRRRLSGHDEVQNVKTVEEKQIKLNMPKYYGFKCYVLHEEKVPYDNLRLTQHVTKTHLSINKELPEYFKDINVDDLYINLKSSLEEALLIELEGHRRIHDIKNEELSDVEIENVIGSSIGKQLNRIIINKLSNKFPHLLNSQADENPRVEATWYAGGMIPPTSIVNYRKKIPWLKDFVDTPINRLMSYIGTPILNLRCDLPLKPIVPYSEAENTALDVPEFKFDPRSVGTVPDYRRIINTPGFWPGDPHQFGILSYHKRGHILTRTRFNDPEDDKETIHRQALLASFGWLSAQANFLGFNTLNDITYPLVTQTIVTNGKLWSFYVYQLNTMLIQSYVDNIKRNICWGTPELQLYEKVENGKLVGLNEDVLKVLLKFYTNVPEKRLGLNMTPYLNAEEKVIADYLDSEKREWLEREYKFLVSNRPRLVEIDEIYPWEKIYKVDHKTRFMDKKRRFFELNIKPGSRRLNDRLGKYIPRALRPDLPRHKGRRAKEFWP